MVFNYKTPISKELKSYLLEYTNELDVAKVCEKHDIGFYALRRLRVGTMPVSNKKNEKGLIELMRVAVKNAESIKEKATSDTDKLHEILDLL